MPCRQRSSSSPHDERPTEYLSHAINGLTDQIQGSSITSISRDDDGRQVIKIDAGDSNTVIALRKLRAFAPFARLVCTTSRMDGKDEIQMTLPTKPEMRKRAKSEASSDRFPTIMLRIGIVLFFVAAGIWVGDTGMLGRATDHHETTTP